MEPEMEPQLRDTELKKTTKFKNQEDGIDTKSPFFHNPGQEYRNNKKFRAYQYFREFPFRRKSCLTCTQSKGGLFRHQKLIFFLGLKN